MSRCVYACMRTRVVPPATRYILHLYFSLRNFFHVFSPPRPCPPCSRASAVLRGTLTTTTATSASVTLKVTRSSSEGTCWHFLGFLPMRFLSLQARPSPATSTAAAAVTATDRLNIFEILHHQRITDSSFHKAAPHHCAEPEGHEVPDGAAAP